MPYRRYVWVGLLLIGLLITPVVARASWLAAPERVMPTHGLSSLNGGVQGFLERRGSGLASAEFGDQRASQIIESHAAYYNVEVRVLLTVLEITSGLIGSATVDPALANQPFGAGPAGFEAQIEWAARELRAGLGPYDSAPSVTFSDGSRRQLDLAVPAEQIAVERFLAPGRTQTEWERLLGAYGPAYERLFANEPLPAPPTPAARLGFLSLPWPAGSRMIHSSYFDHTYPMVDSGGDGNSVMVNYKAVSGLSYNSHDGHDYYFPDSPYGTPIIAAAPGWAFARTTRGLGVVIQHSGAAAGYESVYWHLEAFAPVFDEHIDSGTPLWIERGELLGWSGSTGFTDGAPHLHFEIRHNGKQVDPYGWYGPGPDPCTAYVACEASVWLWDDSVPWQAPDAPLLPDTTPPVGLLTLNPDPHLRLLAQFDGTPLPAVGMLQATEAVGYGEGRWGKAARVGRGTSLTYPASPTLELAQGTLALWVEVPDEWGASATGRHYLAAASINPADPAQVYSGTWALRHEERGPDDTPVWNFWTVSAEGQRHDLYLPDALNPGWHHVAVTWDSSGGHKALYVDGTLAAQASGASLPRAVGDSFELGRWTSGAGESDVALDEVSSYDRVLAPLELRGLASAQAPQSASARSTASRQLLLYTPALDNGGGVVQVQLGLNGLYAAPTPYYTAYSWTLPGAEGQYTVTVRLADRVGNTTTLTQTIWVNQPPQATVAISDLTPLKATLVLSATDSSQPIEMALSASPTPLIKRWEPLAATRSWSWTPMQPRRVYVWFRDALGAVQGPFVVGPDRWTAYLPATLR